MLFGQPFTNIVRQVNQVRQEQAVFHLQHNNVSKQMMTHKTFSFTHKVPQESPVRPSQSRTPRW
jgi:hypothetical protein